MEVGALARVDGMEGLDGIVTCPLEDSAPLIGNREQLRERASRDGFLFFRGLLPEDGVLPLRRCVLDYASQTGWLDPRACVSEARAAPGKRIGYYQDPEWVNLQVHVQNRQEMWAVGNAVAIHRGLHAVEDRSIYPCLSMANTCHVFSPHPDMATQPHQDAYYVRMIEDFWTAWMPLGDCPRELGPLALLAGSHHGGLREHSFHGSIIVPDDAVWSTTDFRCGDVVLFRSHTVHCSLPNRSGDRLRLSADFRYGYWSKTDAVDWRATSIGR